jgi:phosphoribosylformimino-5-aminoimidazole carboxamide ribotide isomerase
MVGQLHKGENMRVIPVIDIRKGLAVWAVAGQREEYRPVSSCLVEGADPLRLAQAFREKLGLQELYVADLDAIQGKGHNYEVIATLAQQLVEPAGQARVEVMVDAGTTSLDSARRILALGASKVIIGSETLQSWSLLEEIAGSLDLNQVVLSLDLTEGKILSPPREMRELSPEELIMRARALGIRELIVLELRAVGSEAGPDLEFLKKLVLASSAIELIAGGGVRDVNDLHGLEGIGIKAALVATALHKGKIGRKDLEKLARDRLPSYDVEIGSQGIGQN